MRFCFSFSGNEPNRFRCLKHWLKGKSRGQTEIFIDNLPFGPDNINLAPDGTFWIALISVHTTIINQQLISIATSDFCTDLSSLSCFVCGLLLQIIHPQLQFIHRSKVLKNIVATFPWLWKRVNGAVTRATVANVDAEGKIIKIFDDPTGKVMSFVTSAFEFEGHLYLGSLQNNFLGKLPLETARDNM